jgi:hypothetical protein
VTDGNPHFETAPTWRAAAKLLSFEPRRPTRTEGCQLQGLRVHIRDHKRRELPVDGRTLEAHYGKFVVSQSKKGAREARRLALDVLYGRSPMDVDVAGRVARRYELGPEPPPDDIDGRSPSVVVWNDSEMFYLIASSELASEVLITVARSIYE